MKILIVDDEKLIAQGVAYVIKQFGAEYGAVDTAFSGSEALEKMGAARYDLTITDVSMPGLSGLDLIEEAKKRGLCGDFCVLSGYSEFEYARTALQLGVEDYLLKPVDKGKLKKMLEAFREKQLSRSRALRRNLENLLADCLFGSVEPKDAWPFGSPLSAVVAESLFGTPRGFVSRQDFSRFLDEGLVQAVVHIRHLPAFVLFGPAESRPRLVELLSAGFPHMSIGSATGSFMPAGADAGYGAALRSLYRDALHAALTAHCFLDRQCLDAAEFPRPKEPALLAEALKAGLRADVPQDRLLLYQICWRSLDAAGSEPVQRDKSNPYVAKMVALVDEHFAEDLTLASVARDIGLNPEYAGKLFRAEEGQSFADYLNRYRIARILECIAQDPALSFEQLAPCMGFQNLRNFYRIFKRLMQTTPGQYKASL